MIPTRNGNYRGLHLFHLNVRRDSIELVCVDTQKVLIARRFEIRSGQIKSIALDRNHIREIAPGELMSMAELTKLQSSSLRPLLDLQLKDWCWVMSSEVNGLINAQLEFFENEVGHYCSSTTAVVFATRIQIPITSLENS